MSVQYLASINHPVDISVSTTGNDEFDQRRLKLIELLQKYAYIVSNHNTTRALEKHWLSHLRYKAFKEEFDQFIDETLKVHEELNWFNPFINRHYFNALMWAPVFLIGQHVETLEDLKQLCLEETPVFIQNQTLFDKLLREAKEENTHEAFRVYLHLEGSRKYREELQLLIEALVEQRYQIYNEFKTQGDNWKTLSDENKAYQNLRYEALLCDFLCELYQEPRVHQVLNEREKISLKEVFGESLSGIPYYLYLLETSTHLYELLYASYSLKKYTLEEILKYISKTAYSALYARFEAYTGVPFDVNINYLYTETSTALMGSSALSEEGLLATVKSEPTIRWIRTLNGEIYVSRSHGDTSNTSGLGESSGETQTLSKENQTTSTEAQQKETITEPHTDGHVVSAGSEDGAVQIGAISGTKDGERPSESEDGGSQSSTSSTGDATESSPQYRFYRTSTGVVNKFQLLESISRYGKEEAQIEGLIYTEDGYVTMQQYQKALKKTEGMANSPYGKAGYVGQEVFDSYTAQQEAYAKSHANAVIEKWKQRVDKPASARDYYYAKLSLEKRKKETETTVQTSSTTTTGNEEGISAISDPRDQLGAVSTPAVDVSLSITEEKKDDVQKTD